MLRKWKKVSTYGGKLPNTSTKQDIDDLDRNIILELQKDARKPFTAIAANLGITEGTVKNRVTRLTKRGILKLEARVNPFALPNKVSALVGINLKERSHEETMREIIKIPQVTSVWNCTGRFDLFFEIMVDSLHSLNEILFTEGLKKIPDISFTETFVMLSSDTKYLKLS